VISVLHANGKGPRAQEYFSGKTSLVTGGNSGIGVETVKALATAGSRVVLTSRSEEAGIKVAEQLMSEGVKASNHLRCHMEAPHYLPFIVLQLNVLILHSQEAHLSSKIPVLSPV